MVAPLVLRRRFPLAAAALALAGAALAAWAPGAFAADTVEDGTLLAASPDLKDPNFSRTVILVLRHDENATLGVVINRPTAIDPSKVFPELSNLGGYSGKLYRGGPVDATRVLFLVRGLAAAAVQGPEIVDKVFLSGDPESLPDLARLADGPADLRIYAGHAVWAANQLAREIQQGAWRAVPGTADLVFSAEPAKLWEQLAPPGSGVTADTGARPLR
ncbi:MAG TPA: YqgE/AlgH family protein [Gammaproteobacteria bacterium]|nr:YqgE/AlgH family protein [Gammaproteobacteria bacterium]